MYECMDVLFAYKPPRMALASFCTLHLCVAPVCCCLHVCHVVGIPAHPHRRLREREAVVLADDGSLPPLAATGGARGQWGPLYGTWYADPSPVLTWKAAAVVGLLEARSEESFRKALHGAVAGALQAVQGRGDKGASWRLLC